MRVYVIGIQDNKGKWVNVLGVRESFQLARKALPDSVKWVYDVDKDYYFEHRNDNTSIYVICPFDTQGEN